MRRGAGRRGFIALVASVVLAVAVPTGPVAADGSWIDGPRANWNRPGMEVPKAPPMDPVVDARCLGQGRPPETYADEVVAGAGWTLYGYYKAGWGIVAVKALSGFDGMCRPMGFQELVFVDGAFAGTISPELMDSRTDGAGEVEHIFGPDGLSASYRRYTPDDPLCCPSGSSAVEFRIERSVAGPLLVPIGPPGGRPGARVSGVVTYRQRSALPPDAVVTVTLEDVSRADAPAVRLGEQVIATAGQQVPIAFEIPYDPAAIDPRHRYNVRARITVGDQLRFISTRAHPVLTQGAPSEVEIVVEPLP